MPFAVKTTYYGTKEVAIDETKNWEKKKYAKKSKVRGYTASQIAAVHKVFLLTCPPSSHTTILPPPHTLSNYLTISQPLPSSPPQKSSLLSPPSSRLMITSHSLQLPNKPSASSKLSPTEEQSSFTSFRSPDDPPTTSHSLQLPNKPSASSQLSPTEEQSSFASFQPPDDHLSLSLAT